MALQAPGGSPPTNPIKYSQIIAEFGTPNNGGLGEFRLGGGENVGSLTNIPLDVGIPVSGEIKFRDFYSKRLNQVVDLHSIANNSVRQDAKDRWNNGNVHVVGSTKTGKTKPPDTIDDRVIVNVDVSIGSTNLTQNHCAVKTGTWDSGTILEIEIGSNGQLYGAGGKGGDGGSATGGKGEDGGVGSSALGIEYACTVNNLGKIQAGYGGGGGGGGREQTTGGGKKNPAVNNGAPGGGGGGGAGFPVGGRGICPDQAFGGGTNGDDGELGKLSNVATGGAGGNYGGDGGDSGGVNLGRVNDTKASDGEVDNSTGGHGTGGDNGYAIVTNQGSPPTLTGNSVAGRVVTSTNPT